MRLTRLSVDKLPGIHPGFELTDDDLDPGINLVVGPNACGKSSLVRALEYLIAGSHSDDPLALSLEAEFEAEAGRWVVLRAGSQVAWRRDGSPSETPPLPDPRFLYCYWLTAEDLLATDRAKDEEIVTRLRRELAGGYDLDALLARDGPFQVGARHGGTEAKARREARTKVGEITRAYESLQRERQRLPLLERRIEEETSVRDEIARVERSLELLEARRTRTEAELALDEFPVTPEQMARLRGDEGKTLGKLDERRKKVEKERGEWKRKRAEAEGTLDETGLGDDAPNPAELELHREHVQKVRELLRDRAARLEERARALADERTAAGRLGAPGDRLPALGPDAVSEAEKLAVEIEGERKTVQELEARLEGAPSTPDPDVLEANRGAADSLRGWLAAAATQLGRILAPVIVVLAGLIVTVVALLTDRWAVALGGAVFAALGAVWVALLAWGARQERSSARARFESYEIDPPSGWTPAEVSDRLDQIDASLRELQEADVRARQAEGDRERLEKARATLGELVRRKGELAAEIGFDPARTAISLHEFVRLVDGLDSARAKASELDEKIQRIDARIRERIESVRAFVADWAPETAQKRKPRKDDDDPGRLEDLEMALEAADLSLAALTERVEAAREARRTLERADEELAKAAQEREEVDREVAHLFEKAGLDSGDRTSLDRRLEMLNDFREREGELREARIAEKQMRSRLEGAEELLALVEAEEERALKARRNDLEKRLGDLEQLKEERTEIRTRVEDAGADRKLEDAMAELEDARAALEEARDQALLAAAGRFLLEAVKEEHRIEHEPSVLRDARERFERFTHHGWTLELVDEGGGFAARDHSLDERRSLGQLSSGTRMQLLLAVRLAWTRTLETEGEPLPLFLDEALTTSDPERFARVAENLASLAAEEGRQVFYLCAQPTDVRLWERALGERPRVIDLTEVRFARPMESGPDDFGLPEREQIPGPDGVGAAKYAARLSVSPVHPWTDPAATHLFHLLRDDLPLLHRLMTDWGLFAQGHLENLLESSAAEHAVPDAKLRKLLEARCRISRLWLHAWRQGRGKPIDRGVLEECPAISDVFIDRVADLADDLSGDPQALLRALPDVPHFYSSKIEQLEEWLHEHGYLLSGEHLQPQEREARVLTEAAGLADPGEIREVVRWLEAALRDEPSASTAKGT